jgi:hypothetical protein
MRLAPKKTQDFAPLTAVKNSYMNAIIGQVGNEEP